MYALDKTLCLVGPYTQADRYKSSCETHAQISDISTNIIQPPARPTQVLSSDLQAETVNQRSECGTRSPGKRWKDSCPREYVS
jgi:hypothetical protein